MNDEKPDKGTNEPDETAIYPPEEDLIDLNETTETEDDEKSTKWWLLVGLVAVLALVFVAWGAPQVFRNNDDTSSTISGGFPSSKPSVSPSATPPVTEQEATVRGPDGLLQMPILSGGTEVLGNSTGFPETPPVVSDELRDRCGILVNWENLRNCMADQQWYIDGVNRFARETGFNWADVERWAADGPPDARFILIANLPGKTDKQARDDVREMIGSNAADTLPIVRHDCIVNTRGLKEHELSPFVDCKRQVRVSLAPLVYKDGKLGWLGQETHSGVFVDCYNLWWLTEIVNHPPPPPSPPTTITTPPPPLCDENVPNACVPPPCVPNTPGCIPPCPPSSPGCTPPCPPGGCITTTTPPPCIPGQCPCPGPCLPSKTNTPNPSKPDGIVPLPTYGPEEETPPDPPSNPAPPPAEMPTDAPAPPTIVAPDATPIEEPRNTPTVAPELPSATTTETVIISDPDA